MNYETELAFAKDLAVKAREIALQYYKTKLEVVTKIDKSPVTIADETINEMVNDAVKRHYPDYGALGEERSWHADRNRLWVCDPIDGTIDFMMGIPTFMFSLALVVDGQPVVAVTCNLLIGDMFWAVSGNGAFLNGEPMRVSSRTLPEARLVFPTNLAVLSGSGGIYLKLAGLVSHSTMIHGPVFKGMLIAQGLCDGSVWPGLVHSWDVAAIKLIVEEAGGRFTDINRQLQRFDADHPGGMVVSNGVIHTAILEAVKAPDSKAA